MNTKQIFEHLKTRKFEGEVKEQLFPILEKHLDRIKFVKGFVDVENILYIEEEGTLLNEFPYFLSTNCKSDSDDHYIEKIATVYDNSLLELEEIKEELLSFFKNTNHILYIDVAFEENILKNEDMWKVYNKMKTDRKGNPFQIMIGLYEYPEWYNVKKSEEIERINESLRLIRGVKVKSNAEKIKELREKIDDNLEKGNFEVVKKLSEEIKKVEKMQDALF